MTNDRESAFAALVENVRACRLCPRMDHVQRVLGWGNGALRPRVMFIGEAPGRLGAEQTGLPFHGDVAGHNFERLLVASGLSRNDVFITNAVLCNPQKEDGTNDTPSKIELANCAKHLEAQIKLIDPKIVAPLGAKALAALSLIEAHNLDVSTHVRTARLWFNRTLVPLYHPGQRAMIHRNFANQQSDYYFLASLLRPVGSPKTTLVKADVLHMVLWILRNRDSVSLFALHKLLFLAEIDAVKTSGARATSLYFIRQKDGPYCTDLASITRRRDAGIETYRSGQSLMVREGCERGDLFDDQSGVEVSAPLVESLRRVLVECESLTDAQLKQRAYRSVPMRRMLRLEQSGHSCLNRPLFISEDITELSKKAAAQN